MRILQIKNKTKNFDFFFDFKLHLLEFKNNICTYTDPIACDLILFLLIFGVIFWNFI